MKTYFYRLVGIITTQEQTKTKVSAFVTSLSGKNYNPEIPEPLSRDLIKIVRFIEAKYPVMQNDIEVARNIIALYKEQEDERPPP